ncbi:MAG: alanine--glyoxylate aminotransferase family protein [Planctomycetes bacterium]|nr:alanine--glyoxylate aminotransferase family protein [Planctomycetota bacterium]
MSAFEPRLFIPGPTEVFPEVLADLSRPVISHRGPEIREITLAVFAKLQRLFLTENECFTALTAATGLMEGVVRNLSRKRILATVCGAFSERQYKVAVNNGKAVDALRVEPGRPVRPEAVEEALAGGDYDLVTLVHSETSTGVLNPVAEIAEVVRRHDDILLAVDVVSSLAGAPVRIDDWGVDLAFAGTQKCLALPPGLCLFTVSPRAMDRCASIAGRGHYFDFLNYRKMAAKGQSPATINTSMMVALDGQLDRILEEGLECRWARHEEMARYVRGRLERFKLFPDPDFMSPTLSVFANDQGLEIKQIVDSARRKGKLFGDGYGELAGKTFRIGHMGDLRLDHMKSALDVFEAVLAEQE